MYVNKNTVNIEIISLYRNLIKGLKYILIIML